MVSTLEIIGIFNRIARTYPRLDCGGINGFGTLHDGSILSSNIGKTIADYDIGAFWSRDWEESGADTNGLCLEYPALLLEQKTAMIPNLLHKEYCEDFILLLCGRFDCPDCPDTGCNRTKDQVIQDTKDTLFDIIDEFLSYRTYECTEEVDGESVSYSKWMSDGEYQWMKTNHPEIRCTIGKHSIKGFVGDNLKDKEVSIWEDSGKVGSMVTMRICGCRKERTVFDYSKNTFAPIGNTECKNCG